MNDSDALTRLALVDAALEEGLRGLPTLVQTIARRYQDAMPTPLGSVPLDQLYLAQAPLTHHLCLLAQGQPLMEGRVQRLLADGFGPVSDDENHWARRFLARTGPDLRQLHLDALKRFWAFARVQGEAARDWLSARCREQWAAQAQLRYQDGTLDAELYQQVMALLDNRPGRPWQGTIVLHKDGERFALPGAFVLCQQDPLEHPSTPVLLSTLAHGFEAFGSWTALYQELAERLEDDRQGPALLASLDAERQALALQADALRLQVLSGDLFDSLVAQLEQRQRAATAQAWAAAGNALALRDLEGASATLASAAQLFGLLSSQGLRQTRYVQLLERDMPAWMRNLSHAQLLELILGMRELGLATANSIAPGLPLAHEFADPDWLRQYAHGALSHRLQALGVEVPPERIFVTLTSSDASGALVNPLNPSGSVAARNPEHTGPTVTLTTHSRSLVQLALENLSPLDFDYLLTARVRDDSGQPIPGLTPGKVRRLVRQANVGGSYGRYLLRRLRYSEEAEWRRERHARLLQAKLRLEALKARHRGQLGPDGRGWAWIEAVVANPAPSQRARVGGYRIGVWQLFIRSTPLDGVFLLGPIEGHSAQPVLLYASGSPSRQSWQWFDDRQQVAAQWLNAANMKDYILRHIALAERDAVSRLLGTPALAARVQARLVNNDFCNNAYRSETRLVMASADAQSVSNREVDLQTTAQLAVTLTEVVCMFLPGRIAGVFSLARALWSFVQAYLSVGEDSPTTVLLHVFDGYANLFEAAVALSTSPLFAKLIREVPLGSPVPLHTHYAIRQQRTFLRYRLATGYSEGVYEAQHTEGGASTFYIHDRDGQRYEVLHDGEHWRVVDARMPQAMYKPIVRRNAAGLWETMDEIRWRGATPDIPALLQRIELVAPPPGIPAGRATLRNGQRYVRIDRSVLAIRPGLLPNRYTVVIPQASRSESALTVVLRLTASGGWQARTRQSNLSSEWFDLP